MKSHKSSEPSRIARALCLLMVTGLPAWCGSTITSLSGQVQITAPPSSLVPGADENNLKAMLFMEDTDLSFASAITVDATLPGTYTSRASLTPGTIAAGTVISDTYFHADPIVNTGTRYTGSITFSNEILGVIATTSSLFHSDAILGDPGLTYAGATPGRGLELSPAQDQFSISADRLTLSFSVMTWQVVDDLRIITQGSLGGLVTSTTNTFAAPEPGTVGLLILGFSLLALGLRRAK